MIKKKIKKIDFNKIICKSFFIDWFINQSTILLLNHFRATNFIDKFLSVEKSKCRNWSNLKLFIFSEWMVRILPCWLITNNKDVEWKFKLVNLFINLIVIRLDIDTIRTPLFTIFIFVTGKKHHTLNLIGENAFKNLLRFFQRYSKYFSLSVFVFEISWKLLKLLHLCCYFNKYL